MIKVVNGAIHTTRTVRKCDPSSFPKAETKVKFGQPRPNVCSFSRGQGRGAGTGGGLAGQPWWVLRRKQKAVPSSPARLHSAPILGYDFIRFT